MQQQQQQQQYHLQFAHDPKHPSSSALVWSSALDVSMNQITRAPMHHQVADTLSIAPSQGCEGLWTYNKDGPHLFVGHKIHIDT